MDGIHIVTFYNIPYHFHHKILGRFISRIKIFFITIGKKPFRMYAGDMIGSNTGRIDIEICPVRIQPGMKLHTSFMRFLDHELHGIIIRRRRLSLYPRQPLAPGFKIRWVKCICCRTNLYDHGVHAILFMQVQLTNEISFLLFGG